MTTSSKTVTTVTGNPNPWRVTSRESMPSGEQCWKLERELHEPGGILRTATVCGYVGIDPGGPWYAFDSSRPPGAKDHIEIRHAILAHEGVQPQAANPRGAKRNQRGPIRLSGYEIWEDDGDFVIWANGKKVVGTSPAQVVAQAKHMKLRNSGNPYIGDAFEIAKYKKKREEWEKKGRRGPPPPPPTSKNPSGPSADQIKRLLNPW